MNCKERIRELEAVCGELYQVIAVLAYNEELFNDPQVIKALDNASDAAMTHDDVLPFMPKFIEDQFKN